MDGEDEKTYDFTSVLNAAQNAFKTLHKRGKYKPEDLGKVKEYQKLIDETRHVINTAISHEVPQKMREYLEKDIHIFSGLKTHAQLTEARSYLMDNGKVRSFESFEHKVTKLNQAYNRDYLEAEYQFAVSSSQSAANWDKLQENTDRYWLEYRTAADDRVRTEHRTLHGICLPKNDPFWQEYYPPNGWRCRCVAVEVLADDYTKSDSKKSIQKGNAATTQIGKSGKNTLEMFRFNPGTKSCVFPPEHTYNKVVGSMKVKSIITNMYKNDIRKASETDKAKKINDRYSSTEFKEVKSNKKGGLLEIFTKGKQNGTEFTKNKKALEILVDQGEQYRILPVIDDGQKNPDALNLKTNKYADIKVAESTNGKSIIQNALKAASKQKVNEVIIHFTQEVESNRDTYDAIKATFKQGRARTINNIIIITPKNKVLKINTNRFKN